MDRVCMVAYEMWSHSEMASLPLISVKILKCMRSQKIGYKRLKGAPGKCKFVGAKIR
jgi:hypothetical protein